MPKGYWIVCYRSISDPARLAEYAALAVPAITAGGGRVIARGTAAIVYEAGIASRSVVIEFESVAAADATYRSAAYQSARRVLEGVAERDVRIVEGVS